MHLALFFVLLCGITTVLAQQSCRYAVKVPTPTWTTTGSYYHYIDLLSNTTDKSWIYHRCVGNGDIQFNLDDPGAHVSGLAVNQTWMTINIVWAHNDVETTHPVGLNITNQDGALITSDMDTTNTAVTRLSYEGELISVSDIFLRFWHYYYNENEPEEVVHLFNVHCVLSLSTWRNA